MLQTELIPVHPSVSHPLHFPSPGIGDCQEMPPFEKGCTKGRGRGYPCILDISYLKWGLADVPGWFWERLEQSSQT